MAGVVVAVCGGVSCGVRRRGCGVWDRGRAGWGWPIRCGRSRSGRGGRWRTRCCRSRSGGRRLGGLRFRRRLLTRRRPAASHQQCGNGHANANGDRPHRDTRLANSTGMAEKSAGSKTGSLHEHRSKCPNVLRRKLLTVTTSPFIVTTSRRMPSHRRGVRPRPGRAANVRVELRLHHGVKVEVLRRHGIQERCRQVWPYVFVEPRLLL